jgi:hypothetical protein
LKDWDYTAVGWYSITICTGAWNPFFRKIEDGDVRRSHLGKVALRCRFKIPSHFSQDSFDAFIIMPNPMHRIIVINAAEIRAGMVETQHAASLPARFIQADTIVPGGVQGLDRYAYSYNNPVKYTDPSGHWPCSFSSSGFNCSFNTFNIGANIDSFGEKLGIENASDIVSNVASKVALGLDALAGVTDIAASTIVTTGIVVGGTSGAAITLPGGGTAIVTGGAGASVGWATTELGVRPLINAGNFLAIGATVANTFYDLILGDTGLEYNISASSEGIELNGRIAISSSSQVSAVTTTAGWISPLSYPSLLLQTGAILGDLGVISPPPINKEFNLKWDRR